jgi:hypothetical protein
MAIPKNDKHKECARDANHCLEMVSVAGDQDARAIEREMTAEWFRLAETILRPLAQLKSK